MVALVTTMIILITLSLNLIILDHYERAKNVGESRRVLRILLDKHKTDNYEKNLNNQCAVPSKQIVMAQKGMYREANLSEVWVMSLLKGHDYK